ncbi:MAG: hypothetical protein WCJ62_01130 [Flavobacterium sp.]
MKKLFVLALMVVGMATFAQEKEGKLAGNGRANIDPSKRAEMQAQKLKTDLGLNEEQTTQIKSFLTEQVKQREANRAEMVALRESGKQPREDQKKEMRSKMESEKNVINDQMKKILTPQQFEKWKSSMDERKEKIKKRLNNDMQSGQVEKK